MHPGAADPEFRGDRVRVPLASHARATRFRKSIEYGAIGVPTRAPLMTAMTGF